MNLDIINSIANVFTAIGTVGSVVIALWLSYKDNMPKLNVFATIGIINSHDLQELEDFDDLDKLEDKDDYYLWFSCTNVSKQPITVTRFAFTPNRFKKNHRIVPMAPSIRENKETPCSLSYSEKFEQIYYFDEVFPDHKALLKILSPYKWVARLQILFLWRVIVSTNIKEFRGNLSKELAEKILTRCFPENSSDEIHEELTSLEVEKVENTI